MANTIRRALCKNVVCPIWSELIHAHGPLRIMQKSTIVSVTRSLNSYHAYTFSNIQQELYPRFRCDEDYGSQNIFMDFI